MDINSIIERVRQFRAAPLIAAGAGLLIAATSLSAIAGQRPDDGSTLRAGPRVTAPADARIKVQVLNATGTSKLAGRATRYLRDRGFDVVEAGNSAERLDSTVVLDRTGKGSWARLVARSFGVARVETRVDSARFVDVTVLIGADWAPPPGALSP